MSNCFWNFGDGQTLSCAYANSIPEEGISLAIKCVFLFLNLLKWTHPRLAIVTNWSVTVCVFYSFWADNAALQFLESYNKELPSIMTPTAFPVMIPSLPCSALAFSQVLTFRSLIRYNWKIAERCWSLVAAHILPIHIQCCYWLISHPAHSLKLQSICIIIDLCICGWYHITSWVLRKLDNCRLIYPLSSYSIHYRTL